MEPLIWVLAVVFAVSFLSNVSPFVGASYTLLATLYLTLIGPTPLNFVAVAIVSAVGATVAKLVIYFGAFGFKDLLLKNKNVRLIGRYSTTDAFYLALFVTALLPVFPFDDYIYIGAGAVSASLRLMLGVTLLAKAVKSVVEIALEYTILRSISNLLGIHRLDLTLLLTVAFIAIGIIVYKVDWEVAYARLTGKRSSAAASSSSATTGQQFPGGGTSLPMRLTSLRSRGFIGLAPKAPTGAADMSDGRST